MTQQRSTASGPNSNAVVKQTVGLLVSMVLWMPLGQPSAQAVERSGKEVVDAVCVACHGTGVNGAPRIGDKKAWSKLAARGLTGLSQSALKGIRNMPPHGGNPALSDTEVERAITYMVNRSGGNWTEPVSRTAAPVERSGEQVVRTQCVKCHETGVGGAPKIADTNAWLPRLKQGVDPLVRSAINGHGGMPPRGGMANLTDNEIRSAIIYMFNPVMLVTGKKASAGALARQDFAVVGGTTIYVGIIAADTMRSNRKDYPTESYGVPPSAPAQYFVTVALFDSSTSQRIDDAGVRARVSTESGSGPEKTLRPMTVSGARTYGEYFAMGGKGAYKITVVIRRAGSPDVVQAQFDYSHP